MISIIICSRKPDIPQELKRNIAETTGVEYELIIIDNSKNKYSIFAAYNEGVRKAKYPYLCFAHEDILFHTPQWGTALVEHLKNKETGLVGVIGGHYMPVFSASWWQADLSSGIYIQGYTKKGKYSACLTKSVDFLKDKKSIEVVTVDGLWFCIPKSLFSTITFDEQTYPGFHCYDVDICMQVRNAGYKVLVVSDILIEHKSVGNADEQWLKNLALFYFKWHDKLPQIAGITLNDKELKEAEQRILYDIYLAIDRYYFMKKIALKIRKLKIARLARVILKPFLPVSIRI
jgi:GT2 family glycosyltransferase